MNGACTTSASADGYLYLISSGADHHDFPTLTLDQTVTARAETLGSSISSQVQVFTVDFEKIDGQYTFETLSELSAGEYIIVFSEFTDTRAGDERIQDYELAAFDCVFKLIVSKSDVPLSYSSLTVTSGDQTISPVRCLVYTNQYENGENTLCGDGAGFMHLTNIGADHNDLPSLMLDQNVTAPATTAESSFSHSVRVFTVNCEEIEGNYTFDNLIRLPAGEYVIVFNEHTDTRRGDESIQNYWLSLYDCVFKLIVTA